MGACNRKGSNMTGTWFAFLTGGLALVAAGSAAATTTLLDFDPMEACEGVCRRGFFINPSYGTTTDVAVTYRRRVGFGDTTVVVDNVLWWDQGFGDLQGVIYSQNTLEVRFELLTPGKAITLNSLDMARILTGPTRTELRVYDLDWTLLWSAGDLLAPVGGRLSFAPEVSSTSGLILQHGPQADNRALDNIVFTLSDATDPGVIPEPATWAMLIAGFGLVGGVVRRRRAGLPVQG
jgi:hypothetical protein